METLVGFTRDSASVNGSALASLGITVSKAVKLVCFSHVINRWGQSINVPLVDQLVSSMNMLLGHSAAVRASLSDPALTSSRPKVCLGSLAGCRGRPRLQLAGTPI
jgi:hypothetical protein